MSADTGITERINMLIERHCKGNVAKFAASIGVKRSGMSKISRGESNPQLSTLQAILEVYPDTDANWLIIGIQKISGPNGHKERSQLNDPEGNYGDKNLIELIREQFKVKDEQIARLIEKIK